MDGTILNTAPGILRSVDEMIRQCGLTAVCGQRKNAMIGPPIDQSIARVWGLSEERTQQAAAVFRSLYAEKYLMYAEPYPGILELLNKLRAAGWKVGVATYKRDDYAQRLMKEKGVTQACDFVLGSDGKKQTKADIIRVCLRELQGMPDQSIMIGDTVHDLTGAQNAGLCFLGVCYGYGFKSKEEILQCGAQYAAVDANELENKLMEIGG